MKFNVMYYFSIACPTTERTLLMIDEYVRRGVTSVQIDLPSKNPFAETDFVKGLMGGALAKNPGLNYYLDAIRQVRKNHPQLEISIVVYPDVIETLGSEQYLSFLQEIGAENNMIAGDIPEIRRAMEERGITYTGFISYAELEADIEKYRGCPPEHIICMRTRRETEPVILGKDTWADRVALVRAGGITNPLYAIAEIADGAQLAERKAAGMQGAIIGNILMRLWDDEKALWELLDEFQAQTE